LSVEKEFVCGTQAAEWLSYGLRPVGLGRQVGWDTTCYGFWQQTFWFWWREEEVTWNAGRREVLHVGMPDRGGVGTGSSAATSWNDISSY